MVTFLSVKYRSFIGHRLSDDVKFNSDLSELTNVVDFSNDISAIQGSTISRINVFKAEIRNKVCYYSLNIAFSNTSAINGYIIQGFPIPEGGFHVSSSGWGSSSFTTPTTIGVGEDNNVGKMHMRTYGQSVSTSAAISVSGSYVVAD